MSHNTLITHAPAMRPTLLTAALTLAASSVFAQALPMAKPESVGMSTERLAKIGAALQQEVNDKKLPGAVVMVARKGKLVYSTSVGSLNNSTGGAMSPDALFRIYSMTKPLVSTALMMLVEDGKVQLTDPVSKFLPSFKGPMVSVPTFDPVFNGVTFKLMPANREPTIQDLLRHTSGIAYGELTKNTLVRDAYIKAGVFKADLDYDSRTLSGAEMADGLGKAPLAQQPGTAWEYSLSVDVQGRVVEAVSGKRLNDFMQERMFKPLKMTDTGFSVPAAKLPLLAEAFPKDPATGAANKLIDVSKTPGNDSGGAGAVSTAGDYLRYCQAMLNGGQLDGARILSRTTVNLMASDHLGSAISTTVNPGMLLLGTPGYTFGLGFLVRQSDGIAGVHGTTGEFMWAGYAGTFFWAEPKEQICAVYMTQAPSPIRAYYRRFMKDMVAQAIVD
ncbi:serine hydrolase [Limnohabitans sp. B9-3]|uniref:serine hydrolase domain-containing protein n=1 Tax=Limnohabitans sp. B9-3 TaxID=1100707 RepID=UPI001E62A533|nr:serine hydrolase domain-containing protein [Limnohabitans sp. B9-3]